MAANLAAYELKQAVEPKEDRAQGANFGQADTEVLRQNRQDDADIDPAQIEQAIGAAERRHQEIRMLIEQSFHSGQFRSAKALRL